MKLKGKWLPSNKQSDMREEDHKDIIKALGTLNNKVLKCSLRYQPNNYFPSSL